MTTPLPQHAIDAAQAIMTINSVEENAAIIDAHPDPELARLREELHIRNAELKTVCEYKDEYAKIAKRNEGENDQLRADMARLEHENSALITQADQLRAEVERLTKAQPINTHVRLFDLVRYMRVELHSQDLITDDEYHWLTNGASLANDPKGGSPSPRRLEDYDALRARVDELESQLNDAREYGARMQRERDDWKKLAESWESTATQYLSDAIRLENKLNALRLVCGTTDANKFETALDRANAKIKELVARIIADNKAYGCELRDPYGTIWEYAETLKKRIAELELQTFDIKALEADKARLDWLEEVHAGCNHGPSDKPTMFHCWVEVSGRHENPADHFYGNTLRAAIDAARNAQPAANTGDNHRMEGSDNA